MTLKALQGIINLNNLQRCVRINYIITMTERTMYAVTVGKNSTEIATFKLNLRLAELKPENIFGILESLTATSSTWQDVIDNKRSAVIFDAITLEQITIRENEPFIHKHCDY